jgi:hypothetical protein
MKKNEIRTDRKHPLTTPEHASVLRALCLPSRVPPPGCVEPEEEEILFRKREKEHFSFEMLFSKRAFFFFQKKSLLLLSYLFFNSKVMSHAWSQA